MQKGRRRLDAVRGPFSCYFGGAKHEFACNFLGFVKLKSSAAVSLRATAWQLFLAVAAV